MSSDRQNLKDLPAVDRVLRATPELVVRWGHERTVVAIRNTLEYVRRNMDAVAAGDRMALLTRIIAMVKTRLEQDATRSLIGVFNLTGTVLHTNLGRAALPGTALDAVLSVSGAPCNLEYDLQTGARGDRDDHVETLLCELCGAPAATVVNNNAAAVLLTLNTLADNAEVPVSRGELVEIGDSFRLPELMQSAGCSLLEVGTTNRTYLRDYANAINPCTALLLKVHTSNYQIRGFTHSVTETGLAQLAHQHGLPLVVDLGSGNLIDFAAFNLPAEPTVAQTLKNGVDLVTFSGDKLLGGPQCGIIAGQRELVGKLKSNPLKRALRVDKMTLAAMVEVLKLYQDPSRLAQQLPTYAALSRRPDEIRAQAQRLVPGVAEALAPHYEVALCACDSQVGSGALPLQTLPGYGLKITAANASGAALTALAASMRRLPIPVIGRINNGTYVLDLRCLDREESFVAQLEQLAAQFPNHPAQHTPTDECAQQPPEPGRRA